jgi:Ni/Co efflux regulator RcnB
LLAAIAVAAVVALPATAMANDRRHGTRDDEHRQMREHHTRSERHERRGDEFSADLDRVRDEPQASAFSNAKGEVHARLVGDNSPLT